MKAAIARRFAAVSRSLSPTVKQRLHQAVPLYQARTRGVRHPQFEYQQALSAAKWAVPGSTAGEHDAMAFYLVAIAGMAELDPKVGALRDSRDRLSELSEEQQLRMQMAMDRLAKTTSTLNNIMKKMSTTAEGIIQNLK